MLQTEARDNANLVIENLRLKSKNWARRKSETVIKRKSKKGLFNISLKLPKKLYKSVIIDEFISLGYTTSLKNSNILLIKW